MIDSIHVIDCSDSITDNTSAESNLLIYPNPTVFRTKNKPLERELHNERLQSLNPTP